MGCTQWSNYERCKSSKCNGKDKTCPHYIGKTRGDILRESSNEEIAVIFRDMYSNTCVGCPISNYHKICKPLCESKDITIHMACYKVWLAWLNQETIDKKGEVL